MELWRAWTLSQAYRSRPSEIYAIEGELAAYCFDNAVEMFAAALNAEMDKKKGKDASRQRQQVMGKWLSLPDSQRFRSPMGATRK